MKKLLVVILVIVLAVAMTGCTGFNEKHVTIEETIIFEELRPVNRTLTENILLENYLTETILED